MHGLPPTDLNVLTADPILRLLVAEMGLEAPAIPFQDGWSVFKRFAAFPTRVADGGATFQARYWDDNRDAVEVLVARQMEQVTSRAGWTLD